MYKILFFLILLLFTGCAVTQKVEATKDNAMIPVDEQVNNINNGLDTAKHYYKAGIQVLTNNIDILKSNIIENKFVKYIVSDETILENRTKFINWQYGTDLDQYSIIDIYLKKHNTNVDVKGLTNNDNLSILNNYFFDKAVEDYKNDFENNNKKPTFNKFLTDRENFKIINEYKLKLAKSIQQWELNLHQTRKDVLALVLGTLYGSVKIENLNYNPHEKKLFMNIISTHNDFLEKVYITVEKEIAEEIINSLNIVPIVYFKLNLNDQLEYVGVTVSYKDKNYLAISTDESYIRENTFIAYNENDVLSLKSLDVNAKLISSNITPPTWFHSLPAQQSLIIGYGMGLTQDEAKSNAFQEISETLSVKVKSDFQMNKTIAGDLVSKRTSKNINLSTDNTKLEGTQTIKAEMKKGIWYMAVSYSK